MNRLIRSIRSRLRATANDRGVVVIWTALLMFVFLGMAAIAVDISRWYVEMARVQKAVDAAALAGAVYMPGNQTTADSTARQVLKANGYNTTATNVQNVILAQGTNPSQYKVTMTTRVNNAFAGILGVASTSITRTAVADYAAPLAVGSPCNVLGYESPADSWASGNCPTNTGKFYANIAGKNTNKARGDAYAAGYCSASEASAGTNTAMDNCGTGRNVRGVPPTYQQATGLSNLEYKPEGYFYIVRAEKQGDLRIQGYDIGYRANSGDLDLRMNQPHDNGVAFTTTVTVRRPSTNPWRPQDGAEICTRTIDSSNVATTVARWVDLCPSGSTASAPAGDYSVQIQTSGEGGGMNHFALRASLSGAGATNSDVSIFAHGRMSLFTNDASGKPTFKFVRLDSSARNRFLVVRFFDLGDVSSATGTVTARLLQPDKDISFDTCTRTDHNRNQSLTNCSVSLQEETNSGLWTEIVVEVPDGYRCTYPDGSSADDDQSMCWVKVELTPSANIYDITTWEAQLLGDPVRIVE